MSCRPSHPRLEWSCPTNMFWDISQATRLTTLVGARSKSSCARREGSLPSTCSPRPVTTRRTTRAPLSPTHLFVVSFVLALFAVATSAQIQLPPPPQPLPPGLSGDQGSAIKVNVNLVVLHTTVLDDRGRFVDGLKLEDFRVFENKVEQKLSV